MPRGRQVVGEPKDRRLGMRVSESFLEKLKKCAEMAGTTQVEILEKGVDTILEQLTTEKKNP